MYWFSLFQLSVAILEPLKRPNLSGNVLFSKKDSEVSQNKCLPKAR